MVGAPLHFLLVTIFLPLTMTAPCNSGPSACQCETPQGNLQIWCEGLTSIPDDLPKEVQNLRIHKSTIETIPGNSFTNYQDLRELYIENTGVKTVSLGAFNTLDKLRILSLNGNPIENLHTNKGSIGSLGSLREFHLMDCGQKELTPNMFQSMSSVQVVNLQNNQIEKVPANIFGHYLTELYLDNNPITEIGDGFTSLRNLAILSFENCQIDTIEKTAFRDSKIQTLILKNNKVTSIPVETFNPVQNYLRSLDLSGNPMKTIEYRVFKGLGGLSTLNLSATELTDIPQSMFGDLLQLSNLDISKNKFTKMLTPVLAEFTKLGSRMTVNFCDNPWHCDCSIEAFRDWLKAPNIIITDQDKCVRCVTPKVRLDKLIKELDDKEIAECIVDGPALTVGAIVGIAVAGGVVLIVIIIVLICCCCKKRAPKEDKSQIHYQSEKEVKEGVDGPHVQVKTSTQNSVADDSFDDMNLDLREVSVDESDQDVKRTPETRLKSASKYSAQPMPEDDSSVNLPKESSF